MRVLVCGGRKYNDKTKVYLTLDALKLEYKDLVIIQGGAQGADGLARSWARLSNVKFINEPAKWQVHGRAAGPIRNEKMLFEHQPDLVIAFPGGPGTAHMISIAQNAGVPVRQIV